MAKALLSCRICHGVLQAIVLEMPSLAVAHLSIVVARVKTGELQRFLTSYFNSG
jgi:hypothetical protein